MKTILVITALLIFNTLNYSKNQFSIIIKGGTAEYNISFGGFGGGGPYYTFWEKGYHFAAGIEYKLNDNFSAQGIVEFSSFKFDTDRTYGEKVNNAKNNLIDLMANIKWNLDIFYFIVGAGFSAQMGDEVRYLEKNEYHDSSIIFNARNVNVFAGLLGFGFDIHIYSRISLIAEANIRMREYAGTNLLLGVKYNLW